MSNVLLSLLAKGLVHNTWLKARSVLNGTTIIPFPHLVRFRAPSHCFRIIVLGRNRFDIKWTQCKQKGNFPLNTYGMFLESC
jgi:hypothetical protein